VLDSHLAYTDDNGENIEDGGEFGVGYVHSIAKANDGRFIYYLSDDDALWLGDDDGIDWAYEDHILPMQLPGFWGDFDKFTRRQHVAGNGSNIMACAKSWVGNGSVMISDDNGDSWVTGTSRMLFDSKPLVGVEC